MSGLDDVRRLADALLFEGYVLYPYRASSTKNQYRWTFGILAPAEWVEAGGCEPSTMRAQCLVEGAAAQLEGQVRFLHRERRRVQRSTARRGVFVDVERLEVDGRLFVPFDEAEIREVALPLRALEAGTRERPFRVPASRRVEVLEDADGEVAGRLVWEREAVQGLVRLSVREVGSALSRVELEITNVTPWAEPAASRERALGSACISTHALLAVRDGELLSLLDPPPSAREAAAACVHRGCFPVLVGDPRRRDRVLVSPILLEDHPRIAPESAGDFFDSSEIDEMLALRVTTLTDEEKRQARATDPRAAAIVDRVDALSPAVYARLHGAVRELTPLAALPEVGARVRLTPGRRCTDARDLLYAGHTARVERRMKDIEGHDLLAVTIDDDPAADHDRWYGRFHFYYPDEVLLLDDP